MKKVLSILFLLLMAVESAHAVCPQQPPEENFRKADLVFTGRVKEIHAVEGLSVVVSFLPSEVYKGNTDGLVRVRLSAEAEFELVTIEDEYIIYGFLPSYAKEYQASWCKGSKLTSKAREDLKYFKKYLTVADEDKVCTVDEDCRTVLTNCFVHSCDAEAVSVDHYERYVQNLAECREKKGFPNESSRVFCKPRLVGCVYSRCIIKR